MSLQWKKATIELLQDSEAIPLFGNAPAFPFDAFNEALKKHFDIPDLHIESHRVDWVSSQGQWREGCGENPTVLALEAPRLTGRLFWIVSVEEMKELCLSLLLSSHSSENLKDIPLSFLKGFYRFLCLKALDALVEIDAFSGLRFCFSDQQEVPEDPMMSIEISMTCKGRKSFAKIFVPQRTLGSFKELFCERSEQISTERASAIDVMLSLVVGNCVLNHTAWNQIHIGDFLILDQYGYDPTIKQGKVRLFLEGHSIALCHLNQSSFEILQYLSSEEEIMEDEENYSEENPQEFEEQPLSEEEKSSGEQSEEGAKTHPIALEEVPALGKGIPLQLYVEIARIKMSLDQVLALRPGNLIELPISPQQGVTIMAHGRAIARGDLLLLGETLGVKITEVG